MPRAGHRHRGVGAAFATFGSGRTGAGARRMTSGPCSAAAPPGTTRCPTAPGERRGQLLMFIDRNDGVRPRVWDPDLPDVDQADGRRLASWLPIDRPTTEGATTGGHPCGAMDDGQRRQAVRPCRGRPPRLRAGRLLRLVRRQGRPRRRRAVWDRAGRRGRHPRRRRPSRPAARMRRVQPDVARHRRARPNSRSRRQRGDDGCVHQRQRAGGRSGTPRHGVRARTIVDLRHRHQPRLRRARGHRGRGHLRPHRQGHHRRGVRHHSL